MFYQKFCDAMRKTGVSMYQVSKETGIAQSTISRWKNQNSIPSLKTVKIWLIISTCQPLILLRA